MASENFYFTTLDTFECKDYSLVMPSVGISNAGQMAVDMLLFNLKDHFRRIGEIYDEAVLPVVGRDLDGKLCHSLEVYQSEELKIILLQQRAPFAKGRIPAFRSRLMNWFKTSQFRKVIMLSGVSSHVRTDAELNSGSPFRFICVDEAMKATCSKTYGWLEYSVKKSLEHKETLELPGSGIVKSLFEDCQSEKIPFVAMLVFCNQGDTRNEISCLLQHLRMFLPELKTVKSAISDEWIQPLSWRFPSVNNRLMIF